MDTADLRKCPYCKQPIEEGQEKITCTVCGACYHTQCWQQHGGCMNDHPAPDENGAVEDVQAQGGETSGEGNSGASLPDVPPAADMSADTNRNIVQDRAEPGREPADILAVPYAPPEAASAVAVRPKKKVGLICLIVAAAVLIVGSIAGYFIYQNIQEKKREEAIATYRQDAKTFCDDMLLTGTQMEDVGNALLDYWGTYVSGTRYYNGHYMGDVNDAVLAAQTEQSATISQLQNDAAKREQQYKKLLKLPVEDNSELQEIKQAAKELYETYQDMYSCVIDVSGNYINFKSDLKDVDDQLVRKYKALKELL